ncbi:MAG: Major Facilitator Superfamily [Rhodobacteraceae bacterium HLUCCA08]|nr:MAG: Major Facilitator Superfamily [Rhodobacteraceae bacterium HLUCCA08]
MSVRSALAATPRPALAFLTLGLFWGTFAAQVPVLKAGLGVGDAQFGTVLLGSAFGLVTSMWLAPRLDRALGGAGMQVATVLLALAVLGPGLASGPVAFFAAMVALGLASGLLDVLMNTRVSEAEARHGRSLMNANHGLFSLGYAIGAILTGLAREAGAVPVQMFAGYTVLALLLATRLRLDPEAVVAPGQDGPGRFPFEAVLLCGGVVLVAFMSEATVEAWSALHIERTLQGGAAEGALGPATLGLTMALGRFSGQALSHRAGAVTVIVWASMLSACGAVIAAAAPAPVWAYLGFGILGLGVSVIGPLGLALVGRMVPPHRRTDAISKVAVMGFSGFFLAPVGMGFASEAFGLRAAFAGVACVLLIAAPLALAIRARHPAGRAVG